MNRTVLLTCHITARVAAVIVAAIGCISLIGWTFDLYILKAFSTDGVSIKTNAAICLILTGVALNLACCRPVHGARRALVCIFAVATTLIGALTFGEHLTSRDFGIDQLLFTEPPGALATTSPNRMGPPASMSFSLSGVALVLLVSCRPRRVLIAQCLALLIILIALVPLIGYAYDIAPLYGISRYTGIAAYTAFALLALGLGIAVARPEAGLMTIVTADDAGGLLARRLLPAAVFLPLFLGWARTVGARSGHIDDAFGRAFLVLSLVVSLTALIGWTAGALSALSRQRDATDAQLRDALHDAQLARADAERASRLKDEFLATLSHELRTPLNAILGWSQLLQAASLPAAERSKGVEVIERNARAQARIIEDLLDMSRIISGKLHIDPQPVAPESFIEAAIATVNLAADSRQIHIEKRLDPAAGPVAGDSARLQQVVWNLLSNAIKFTPHGGRVAVGLERTPSHAVITVSDTGQGLAPESLPFVFNRFWQADGSTTRHHGGVGLGLAIVKHLVELHGGHVTADSPGLQQGATFTVHLPLAHVFTPAVAHHADLPPTSSSHDSRPAPQAPAAPKIDLTGLRILVVDDEPDACDLVRCVLADAGAEVATAGSTTQGLARLADGPLDLLLSDIAMPEIDGYELIRRVRTSDDSRLRELPAIALTAFARSEDRTRALKAGFDAHLAKPIEPANLLATVAAVACRRGARASD